MGTYYDKDIKVIKVETYNKKLDESFEPKTKVIKHWFKKDEVVEGYERIDHYYYESEFLTKDEVLVRLEKIKTRGQIIETSNDGTINVYNKPCIKVHLSNGDKLLKDFDTKEKMLMYIDEQYPELRAIS